MTRRLEKKRRVLLAAALVAAVLLAWWGWRAYRNWTVDRLVRHLVGQDTAASEKAFDLLSTVTSRRDIKRLILHFTGEDEVTAAYAVKVLPGLGAPAMELVLDEATRLGVRFERSSPSPRWLKIRAFFRMDRWLPLSKRAREDWHRILGRLRMLLPLLEGRAVGMLVEMSRSEAACVRRFALERLASGDDPAKAFPVLKEALQDAEASVRTAAVTGLMNLKIEYDRFLRHGASSGEEEASWRAYNELADSDVAPLLGMLGDSDPNVARHALETLARHHADDSRVRDKIIAIATDPAAPRHIREMAVRDLWHAEDARVTRVLLTTLSGGNRSLRHAASISLCRRLPNDPETAAALTEALESDYAPLLAAALGFFEKWRYDGMVEDLLGAYDTANEVGRENIILVLKIIADGPPPERRPPLPRPPEGLRKKARKALEEIEAKENPTK